MDDLKVSPKDGHSHTHPDGRRCCGRPLSEKCSPGEEASKTDAATGKKTCCKGQHNHE